MTDIKAIEKAAAQRVKIARKTRSYYGGPMTQEFRDKYPQYAAQENSTPPGELDYGNSFGYYAGVRDALAYVRDPATLPEAWKLFRDLFTGETGNYAPWPVS